MKEPLGAVRGGGGAGAGVVRLCDDVSRGMGELGRLAQHLRRSAQTRLETSAATAVSRVASRVSIVGLFANHDITYLVMCRKAKFGTCSQQRSRSARGAELR